jgi:hypothetical protein
MPLGLLYLKIGCEFLDIEQYFNVKKQDQYELLKYEFNQSEIPLLAMRNHIFENFILIFVYEVMPLAAVRWYCKCTHIIMAHSSYMYNHVKNSHMKSAVYWDVVLSGSC